MKTGPSPKGLLMRRKVLSASAKAFLQYGYAKTSSRIVTELLGVCNGSPFYHYGNKEGVLLELARRMFAGQFETAEHLVGPDAGPLRLYAAETAVQLHIAELSEPLRELYVTAYTLPSTSQYIHQGMLPRLREIFGAYLTDTSDAALYELELASAGVTRSFMAEPCVEVFTMERKLRRYLECCFRIYGVPPGDYGPVVEQTAGMDLAPVARRIVDWTVQQADQAFASVMADGTVPEPEPKPVME